MVLVLLDVIRIYHCSSSLTKFILFPGNSKNKTNISTTGLKRFIHYI